MQRPPRSDRASAGRRRARALLPLLVLGAGACLAPRSDDGERIPAGEVGRRMAEGGRPVTGTLEEGRADPPEADPFEPPPEEVLEAAVAEALEQEAPTMPVPIEEPLELVRENPYLRFGERIMVHEHPVTGEMIITKPFPLPKGKGQKMMDLIKALQPFPYKPVQLATLEDPSYQTTPPDPNVVELLLMNDWDQEHYSDLTKYPPVEAAPITVADLLIATAGYERMDEVEDFINLFGAGVRMIEIEAKVVEVVETDTLDVGIRPLGDGTPIFDFPDGTFVDSLDFNLPNQIDPTEALLTLGAIQDGLAFNAVLEALAAYENVSIESEPKIAVREGVPATFTNTQEIPFFTISSINPSGNFTSQLQFKSVGIELYVAPRVVGTATLALDVQVIASQQVGSVITFSVAGGGDGGSGTALPTPLIATRTAKTVVYLRPGESLIIGGLTGERTAKIERRVPLLGDIPLLGRLFRSHFDSTETTYSMFVISPRIVQQSEFDASL